MSLLFNPFVIPFTIGILILPLILLFRYSRWLKDLGIEDFRKIRDAFFSLNTLKALKEIFLECLIHRKVFKVNLLLGYMHMSLAFGWFLLIAVGKTETLFYTGDPVNEIYYPVFFRYFELTPHTSVMLQFFNALMDILLIFILTGLIFAIIKRFRPSVTGIKKKAKHTTLDRLSLTMLWLIFPLRLLAESTTASYSGNGSIISQPLGDFLSGFMPTHELSIIFWWLYSTTLGAFLLSIPFTRYMHIPTEVVLILLRNWGIKTKDKLAGYGEIELQSCSRCGICIDPCQMSSPGGNNTTQMVYFLRDLRYGKPAPTLTDNCLMCGRCNEICPVGIDLTNQRLIQRKKQSIALKDNFSYLPLAKANGNLTNGNLADVVYFAGCMSHLSPSVIRSMIKILKVAMINYLFLDEKGSVCCGRPLKLSGQFEAAKKLIESNRKQIIASGAKTLVTSCPICYKSFREDYNLKLKIVHHSEFINDLLRKSKLFITSTDKKVVYHDPCELGRGSGIYDQPRELLKSFAELLSIDNEKADSLCCGGSLANLSIDPEERIRIQKSTAGVLNEPDPDFIATSCPLCRKSIGQYSQKPVRDIAELVASNLVTVKSSEKTKKQAGHIPEPIEI
jgi:Fe-S oxidoreductase